MKKAVKCYIYTRVSTAIQVDGYSLDAQKDKLRKYAEYQEMEIAGEYCDEGFSGKNIQGRLAFRQMLQDIEDEGFLAAAGNRFSEDLQYPHGSFSSVSRPR